MTESTVTPPRTAMHGVHQAGQTAEPTETLGQSAGEMLQHAAAASTQVDLLFRLAEVVDRYAPPLAAFYFQRNELGELVGAIQLRPSCEDFRSERLERQLRAACQAACRSGEVAVRQQAAPARRILAAPVARLAGPPDAIGFIFPAEQPAARVVMLTQLVACHITLWQVLYERRNDPSARDDAAALVDLLEEVAAAENLRQACYTLVGKLSEFFAACRVAVALRTNGRAGCRLEAVSGVGRFDRRSATASALEAAADEAVLRGQVTAWPGSDGTKQNAALAHKHLCSLDESRSAITIPLRDFTGRTVGALTVSGTEQAERADVTRFLQASETALANTLGLVRRADGGWFARSLRKLTRGGRTRTGRVAVAAACIVGAAMFLPLPYQVRCECQLEPTSRRFVAAPFEGTLQSSLVKPGDLVRAGDVLAEMDAREVRWRRASVAADQNQAIKRRDAAQASRNYADQQIAQLEIERLQLELKLLDYRAENLQIKSPVDGIVTSGDLERAEGAPLTIGQSLFEIAPLDAMIIEVAVPDEEVSHLKVGQRIAARLDAYPGRTWRGTVDKIQPRSEIREGDNVFVVEAQLQNSAGSLRPGMKGRVKIDTDRHSLGWILFHRPCEYLAKQLHW